MEVQVQLMQKQTVSNLEMWKWLLSQQKPAL